MEAIRARKSIRSYQDRQIEEAKLIRVLYARKLAPLGPRPPGLDVHGGEEYGIASETLGSGYGPALCGPCGQYCYPIDSGHCGGSHEPGGDG